MLNVSSTDTLTVSIKELLKFFDEKPAAEKGDATGIIAVIGEDLNTAVSLHCIEAKDARLEIIPGPAPPPEVGTQGIGMVRTLQSAGADESANGFR